MTYIVDGVIPSLAVWAGHQPAIQRLHVFGSRVRGLTKEGRPVRPDSDLDIAIEFDPHIENATLTWNELAISWREQLTNFLPYWPHLWLLDASTSTIQRGVDEAGMIVFSRDGASPHPQ